jgi:hypothetical protein
MQRVCENLPRRRAFRSCGDAELWSASTRCRFPSREPAGGGFNRRAKFTSRCEGTQWRALTDAAASKLAQAKAASSRHTPTFRTHLRWWHLWHQAASGNFHANFGRGRKVVLNHPMDRWPDEPIPGLLALDFLSGKIPVGSLPRRLCIPVCICYGGVLAGSWSFPAQ